jgi:agmatine deiminase
MRNFLLLPLIACILFSCNNKKYNRPAATFYMPAEWEPHSAVWLGWQKGREHAFYPGIATLIKTLAPNVTVKIACDSDSLMEAAKTYLFETIKLDSANIQFYVMPGERYWIRDHGAAFLVNDKGELGIADFDFRMYGFPKWLDEFTSGDTALINKRMNRIVGTKTTTVDSMMAVAAGAKIFKSNIIHEGGSIEVNGKGTLILCEAVALSRNPGKTKQELESEFKRVLGATNIIWMKEGLADDPDWSRRIEGQYYGWGTGGHTDEFVRFTGPNTILLAWVEESEKDLNPVNRINYERMAENLRILESSTDQDGKPFTVIKVPLPDLLTQRMMVVEKLDGRSDEQFAAAKSFLPNERPALGDSIYMVPASSYLNYLVTNGLVILPTYKEVGSSPEKETRVISILQKLYPERKVETIDFMPQNWSGGGIHCSTQQQPAIKQ